jgi:hypothetical protein
MRWPHLDGDDGDDGRRSEARGEDREGVALAFPDGTTGHFRYY